MPLYLALNPDGSRQRESYVRVEDVDLPELKDNTHIKILGQYDAPPDPAVLKWDDASEDFVPVDYPPASSGTSPIMSRGAWMDRIGSANEELLHQLRLDPNSSLSLRAKLERFHSELLRRADVDVRHPSTISAAGELANLFHGYGRITDKAAYVTMLLAEEPV